MSRCLWCRAELADPRARYCSKAHRQTAWRSRRIATIEGSDGEPRRLAYADPPYPGTSSKYYRDEPTFAGEVDHAALIEHLRTFDGWALSTSRRALQPVLALCPPGVLVAPWVKPIGVPTATRGPHNTWEALIYVPARMRQPGVRDWLRAQPARFGGELAGRKPIAFCNWMFALLGALPGDSLEDLFPGTGVVGRAWQQLSPEYSGDGAPAGVDDVSRAAPSDPSPPGGEDVSEVLADTSLGAVVDASLPPAGDMSLGAPDDASLGAALDGRRETSQPSPGDVSPRYRRDVAGVLRDGSSFLKSRFEVTR